MRIIEEVRSCVLFFRFFAVRNTEFFSRMVIQLLGDVRAPFQAQSLYGVGWCPSGELPDRAWFGGSYFSHQNTEARSFYGTAVNVVVVWERFHGSFFYSPN